MVGQFISADTTDILTATPTALTDKNLYAYCDNNPIMRIDKFGNAWETIVDVVSLCASVAQVMANPKDPWAWAGLVGDAADLVPFVTGIGEATRAIKITVKAVDDSDDVVKATRKLYNSSGISSGLRNMTGSYVVKYTSGKTYVGKGGLYRATQSANRYVKKNKDKVKSITWKPAKSNREAFIDEYKSMCKYGGPNNRSIGNKKSYNRIWSPGRRFYFTKYGKFIM